MAHHGACWTRWIAIVAVYRLGPCYGYTQKMTWKYPERNLTDLCGKTVEIDCVNRASSSDSWDGRYYPGMESFILYSYPTQSCKVDITIACLDTSVVSGIALYINVKRARIQGQDILHLSQIGVSSGMPEHGETYTKDTECRVAPTSCGHFMGEFTLGVPGHPKDGAYYIAFESHSDATAILNDDASPIWIDITFVKQLEDTMTVQDDQPIEDSFPCPALKGRVHTNALCEAGDRVNCPASYRHPTSLTNFTTPSATLQLYDWPLYEEICWHDGRPIFTTLAPGPTALAPLGNGPHFPQYHTDFLDLYCQRTLFLPCERDSLRRAGTLRFLYNKLPWHSKTARRTCEIKIQVDRASKACATEDHYGIYFHFKNVHLGNDSSNRGDALYIEKYDPKASNSLATENFLIDRPTPCRAAPNFTSCGQVVTYEYRTDPYIKLVYTLGLEKPEDGPREGDRVLIDYVVLTKHGDSAGKESKCKALGGFMPGHLMCETRDRINCPASLNGSQTSPVDDADQGYAWSNFDEVCPPYGITRLPTTPTTTTATTTTDIGVEAAQKGPAIALAVKDATNTITTNKDHFKHMVIGLGVCGGIALTAVIGFVIWMLNRAKF